MIQTGFRMTLPRLWSAVIEKGQAGNYENMPKEIVISTFCSVFENFRKINAVDNVLDKLPSDVTEETKEEILDHASQVSMAIMMKLRFVVPVDEHTYSVNRYVFDLFAKRL